MYLIYAHNDYHKENGSRIISVYSDETLARSGLVDLLNSVSTANKEDIDTSDCMYEYAQRYPDGWGLSSLPSVGTVLRCVQINDIIFVLVELSNT